MLANSLSLSSGSIILTYIAKEINNQKLGDGTSILILVNIISSLNSQTTFYRELLDKGEINSVLFVVLGAIVMVLGIVIFAEAEKRITVYYSTPTSESYNPSIQEKSFLPLKVNATGVMPIVFATTVSALPTYILNTLNNSYISNQLYNLSSYNPIFVLFYSASIFLFNYFYTFLAIESAEVASNLKKRGASIPGVRPGKMTEAYLTKSLSSLTFIGSCLLLLLVNYPFILDYTTKTSFFKYLNGGSLLILVGVISDVSRRISAELSINNLK